MRTMRALLAALALPLLLAPCVRAEFVWIEGEAAVPSGVTPNIAGATHSEFLSEGKWLQVSVEADKVEAQLPAEGAMLRYDLTVPRAAEYEVWDRIGFEFARSAFSWRIDQGEWATVTPDVLTNDCMELDFWCEVAWLKLGTQRLTQGSHTLEIRFTRTQDKDGKPERVLYASDALCLTTEPFRPNSKWKPGEDYRTEADREAAAKTYALPEPASAGARTSVKLEGAWEVCRDDEQLPGPVAEPIPALPAAPFWTAIQVPGDKNTLRPDLLFAHRIWYRTRVEVPQSLAGRSFFVVFPQNNLNTTVYVNGALCGFDKNPFARVQIDITKAMRPGPNEVWVGIRDAWYGRTENPKDPMKLRGEFNLPASFFSQGWQQMAYPIWGHPESGILRTPELVAAGPVYVSDVFCRPSVSGMRMDALVSLTNPSASEVSGDLAWEAVDPATGEVAARFASQPIRLAAGETAPLELAAPWPDAKLWWPDSPNLHALRVTLTVAGTPVDVSETTFGFREWSTRGKDFLLNGVPWHGWADCHTASDPAAWLDFYHRTNQTMMRFWGTGWMGLGPDETLDFMDRNGVVVRRSAMLDGQAIGSFMNEPDEAIRAQTGTDLKIDLARNWLDQTVAQVKGERNHPSVLVWSIENEWNYITCRNTGWSDRWEPEITKVAQAVMEADPTRTVMTDGGGATKAQTLPVHGDHYTVGSFSAYPTLAYQPNETGGGWIWDQQRPRFIGEELFAEGHNPKYAYFGGEEVFIGQQSQRRAVGICVRMLTEGWRWGGVGAWHFWQGQHTGLDQYVSFAPRAVFSRQWDWSFGSGAKVTRTLGVFNDTHYADPITLDWALTIAGAKADGGTRTLGLAPGTNEKFDVTLSMPTVTKREEGELLLTLAVGGKEVFRDTKAVSVLPPVKPDATPLTGAGVAVYDPAGSLSGYLKALGATVTRVDSLDALPREPKVLLVGKDALDAMTSTSSALAAWASEGHVVLVLEQTNPLRFQGLPCEMEPDQNEGRIAFGEDLGHPVLEGLEQKDLFVWSGDEVVYRNAYRKPERGARSLIQCGESLANSALVEVPVASGLMLLCQLPVIEKQGESPAAGQLLANLLEYAAGYEQVFNGVCAFTGGNEQLARALDAMGLQHTKAAGPLEAISDASARIAIVDASPASLSTLATNLAKVEAFEQGGGWLILCGLTPEGLSDYNRIVGVEHIIRPFTRERITFPAVRNPLAAGLTLSDVVLYSSEQVFPWRAGNFAASDVFSYVVDYEDVAPFAAFQDDFARMMTNGFVSDDAWKYIVNVPAPDNPPLDFTLGLPREEELTEMEWIGNTFYYPVTRVELVADGGETRGFTTEPTNQPQVFPIDPPLKGRDITLRLAEWTKLPGTAQVTGLDNIRLKARRSPEFLERVRPMLNVGGLVSYPRGKGGAVLCNLLFQEQEEVPENGVKKRTILSAILRNLKAPFAGGRTVIAGADLECSQIDLSKQANQYRTERGWFGDAAFTLRDLPTGVHAFAGVPYNVWDFPTSPVPTVVMLGGPGVPGNLPEEVRGIPVGQKADALFFLQTARMDARRDEREVREGKQYVMATYLVTYADGQTAEVPIVAEGNIDSFQQKQPTALPGAQIAWTKPYEGTEFSAVVYSMQWNNPRPEVEIRSIDLVYGPDRRGVPALIAVTAAREAK